MRLDRFDDHQTGFGPCVATMMALLAIGALVGGILARLAVLTH
ncbi:MULTISPECIES: hypothetical protein [Sphingomonas]|uniref:Uncharacterized protein n=1 Tax=Sphingomonas trueperi TaxID=53317 RepID=A0A7X5Y130_9SPHN|nr:MULTISPECIES: hypothetical protein [Sphingomonas]NJB97835.1 hypothetical protein [Sphingomonas trueperi]